VELTNANGASARIIALGASIQSLAMPDRRGELADVVLGHRTVQEYLAKRQFFGATVGRYANRIARGTFTLDGKRVCVDVNDGPNHLHGGAQGFDLKLWTVESVTTTPAPQVVLSLVSADGDAGYPGELRATATYTLTGENELHIDYQATANRPTVCNLSSHAYFNLAGEASGSDVLDHRLTLHASAFTPVDATMIPTGELRPVAGTPFDFRGGRALGQDVRNAENEQIRLGRGYDHNFMLDGEAGALRLAARVECRRSGRVLELLTTAPGLQVYSGNFLDGTTVGKGGQFYRQGDGLCLEPQYFPDAPNQPKFPSARLDPDTTYRNRIVFRFSPSHDERAP
jgi:aldose 1-epimerase